MKKQQLEIQKSLLNIMPVMPAEKHENVEKEYD